MSRKILDRKILDDYFGLILEVLGIPSVFHSAKILVSPSGMVETPRL